MDDAGQVRSLWARTKGSHFYMADYQDVQIARRVTRLVRESNNPDFSLLNFMVIVLLVALVIAGFSSIFN